MLNHVSSSEEFCTIYAVNRLVFFTLRVVLSIALWTIKKNKSDTYSGRMFNSPDIDIINDINGRIAAVTRIEELNRKNHLK